MLFVSEKIIFWKKRKIGENDTLACIIIQIDLIDEFFFLNYFIYIDICFYCLYSLFL